MQHNCNNFMFKPFLLSVTSYLPPATRRCSRRSGFTLIELIVAMGLFAVIVTIAVGGFANAIKAQRQAAALISTNSNVSLAIEQMMREMRTSADFCLNATQNNYSDIVAYPGQTPCYPDMPGLRENISFHNANQKIVKYCRYEDANGLGMIMRGVRATSTGAFAADECDGADFQPITANNVNIRNLSFLVSGNEGNDDAQTFVTITMSVSPVEHTVENSIINIQTSVSSRFPSDH